MLTNDELNTNLDQYAALMESGEFDFDFDFASRFFHATCVGQGANELAELTKRGVDIEKYYAHLSSCGVLQEKHPRADDRN